MVAPIDASRLAGRLAMALRRAGAGAAGSTGAGPAATSGARAGRANGAGRSDRKGRTDGTSGPDQAGHADQADHAESAESAERAERAERPSSPSSPCSLVALLRARLASLDGDPVAHRRCATRLVVEALLGCELAPRLRADPRYPGWIDGVAEALEAEPTWRAELDALVEDLTAPARAAVGGSAVAPVTGDPPQRGSASGLLEGSSRSA